MSSHGMEFARGRIAINVRPRHPIVGFELRTDRSLRIFLKCGHWSTITDDRAMRKVRLGILAECDHCERIPAEVPEQPPPFEVRGVLPSHILEHGAK